MLMLLLKKSGLGECEDEGVVAHGYFQAWWVLREKQMILKYSFLPAYLPTRMEDARNREGREAQEATGFDRR